MICCFSQSKIQNQFFFIILSFLWAIFQPDLCTPPDAQTNLPNKNQIQYDLVASGFVQPTELEFIPGSNSELIVLEKKGKAVLVDLRTGSKKTIVDIQDKIVSRSEQGLLGIAFSNRYRVDKKFFLSYTMRQIDADGSRDISVVSEYQADLSRLREPIRHLGKAIFTQHQPYANHNGGCIRIFPDNFLYLGLGDGGAANDPLKAGQDPNTYLGKLIRMKSTDANPVVEIFAMGLRNPWKFSRDLETGEIYLADVGQDRVEEINLIQQGGNYGWNVWEGDECFQKNPLCNTPEGRSMIQPIHTYRRDKGFSVTGGYVYRGTKVPELYGKYIFGDFGSGKVWALWKKGRDWLSEELFSTKMNISTFGQSPDGEVYFADFNSGKVFRIGKK